MSWTQRAAVLAALGLAAAGSVYHVKKVLRQRAERAEAADASGAGLPPTLSAEAVATVLSAVLSAAQLEMTRLGQIEAKVREESRSRGQQVPEQQLTTYLVARFDSQLEAACKELYERHNTTEAEVERAYHYYKEQSPAVAAPAEQLQTMYRVLTRAPPPSTGNEMPLERLLEIMEATMEALSACMERITGELQDSGAAAGAEFHTVLNQRYSAEATRETAAVHARFGVSRDEVHAAMLKYAQDPTYNAAVAELQRRQAERFKACGIHIQYGA